MAKLVILYDLTNYTDLRLKSLTVTSLTLGITIQLIVQVRKGDFKGCSNVSQNKTFLELFKMIVIISSNGVVVIISSKFY